MTSVDASVFAAPWGDRVHSLLGTWGAPPDGVGTGVLLIAIAFGVVSMRAKNAWILQASRRQFLVVSGFVAAFLSLGYVARFLHDGPRIIDSTTYWLQARAISEGHFAWSIPEPTASFRGRFLIDHGDRLAGIFPPGYPLLLAFGFLIGMPMMVGPLLAAAIVVATYMLARELAHERADAELIARGAAAISIACAALRYHTADTMSHGATALWITLALAFGLRARRTQLLRWSCGAGFALGMVAATRPVSALAIGLVLASIALGAHPGVDHAAPRAQTQRLRSLLGLALFTLPGIGLLLLAQRASTGSAWSSTQLDYYATSDGPPGCFRYGFGTGIGCLFEHGDFVRARLPGGYGLFAALGTTLRRLHLHLSDALNAWPVALMVLAISRRAVQRVRSLGFVVALCVLHMLAYAPFYFDGNYPGGGARLFADVLPAEHAFVAVAIGALLVNVIYLRRLFVLLALMLAGFALHGESDHLLLANREGGRPMFDHAALEKMGISRGLVFVDTDHGFNLAHDPATASSPDRGVVFARTRGDDHDRLLYWWLGEPEAWHYHYGEALALTPYNPPRKTDAWTFESEADWPPLEQHGAWAMPIWASGTCASASRALEITGDGNVVIALPVPEDGAWMVTPRVLASGSSGTISLENSTWDASHPASSAFCIDLEPRIFDLRKGETHVTLTTHEGRLDVDSIALVRPR